MRAPKPLNVQQVQRLLQDGGWVLNDDLTARHKIAMNQPRADFLFSSIYYHESREECLLVWGEECGAEGIGAGLLYRSRKDMEQEIEASRRLFLKYGPLQPNAFRGFHVLYKSIPQGQDFPAHVPALLEQLPALLSIPAEQLNGTLESMKLVNKAIRRIGVPECSDPPIFPALVAYVGEYVRREIGGEWFVRLVDNQGTWEPLIRFADGSAIAVGMEVMDGIASDEGYPPDVMGNNILFDMKNPGGRVRLI